MQQKARSWGRSLAALLLGCAAWTAVPAHAQNIDTTGAWDGAWVMPAFGGIAATFGQTVTVPTGQNGLTGFSFYIDSRGQSRPFRAAVYAWDTAQKHAVGNALWQSGPVAITGAKGVFKEYAFTPPGGVTVVPGQTYVLLGTELFDAGNGDSNWALLKADGYGGGNFVYMSSAMAIDLTSGWIWGSLGANDLAFKVQFAANVAPPAPVPGLQGATLAWLTLGVLGLAWLSKRQVG